jgi:hypothetical protein
MGRERIRANHQIALQKWKDNYLLNDFCRIWKVSPEDMYYISQGHFEEWYSDFIKYMRDEMRNRMKTGKARKIDINDVWGGSRWVETII